MLAGVFAIGYAETKVKVEGFQMLIPEKVPLDHSEVLDRSTTHTELDGGTDCSQLQELKKIINNLFH